MKADDLLSSAFQDIRSEQFTNAERKLRRLLVEPLPQQDLGTIQGLLGAVYVSLGNHHAAVRELTDAAVKNPEDASIVANLCISLKEIGRIDEAITAGRNATKLMPDYAEAHCNLGIALKEKGDLEGAIDSYQRALRIDPEFAEAHCSLGAACLERGDLDDAIASCRQALKIRPNYAQALNNLGLTLKDKGDLDSAIDSYRRALEIRPDYAEAHNNLGVALVERGDFDGAIDSYRRALEIRPDYAGAHNNLGVALLEKGDFDGAIASCQRALEIRRDYAEAYSNLGIARKYQGLWDESITSFEKALAINPGLAEAHDNLCDLYERNNNVTGFERALKRAELKCEENHPKILLRRAQLSSRREDFEAAVLCLEKIDIKKLKLEFQILYFSLLGKSYDQVGRFDEAFSAFLKLNELAKTSPKSKKFNADKFLNSVMLKKDSWQSEEKPNWSKSAGAAEKSLVFLIGFPRSGTTLLDTILRSHPDIDVVEEMPMIDTMRARFGQPETIDALNEISDANIIRLRNVYYRELGKHINETNNKKIIVDKYPLNIASIGLIHRVFPDAKFILVLRHPCDCVLSCFMQNFEPNDAMASFLDLDKSAKLYAAIMSLWLCYKSRLGLDLFELRYENLVQNLEGVCKPLIEFLGLEWDENLKNYQETALNERSIKTPSYNQVIKPLYNQASGRWRNYRNRLEPVLPILRPWIEKLRYD